MKKLIIVSGPTASGKTKTSIAIAQKIQNDLGKKAAVVNFDSLLFYKEISIGTAKPTKEEQAGIEHHMIDIESIKSPMNAAQFIRIGEKLILNLMKEDKIIILVGGSAFYLRALLKGMYESPTPSQEIKDKLDGWYKTEGIAPFIEYLKVHDPQSLVNLHSNDHYRLMRAVEHFEATGTKISDQKKELDEQNPYDFSKIAHPWNILHIYLDLPKDEHFQVITKRTEEMFAQGLMAEIEGLVRAGFSLEEKPLASIGYKEAIELRQGLFATEKECIERISISTRQLAKSQRTFFNKITPKESFNPLHDQGKIMDRVATFIKEEK
ncbi:tRNA (adenosine(37)-N6)-dimethylallyltransferase MiaA [Bacteriovorax stolpii]|uniref:tRNA dimethylallyltransferase n=1 Tax=Bacteriovorax stolpii TaxID=960 RepID=A0A2K9NUX9_BACTC|nr:tRNA (adenosine(37)-N6)-dimethylallyltransferase MiaA [Bacteriovorax stolpii]AUN99312.1 tRNA (adenosine(37)-N6)-dimethylallyltransferase MiaA [Bacteriovorax stolpii]QDK40707.1 tRNA (adenosine(37)-N6)-dimethylallyltransferase MiaA [Bacteriovorax stolpii]TDP55148.1 tRNA dimethylallyltransferase [Bacteriovorax stolpii]